MSPAINLQPPVDATVVERASLLLTRPWVNWVNNIYKRLMGLVAQVTALEAPASSVPFAAGNFTGSGAMTWTLTAPDQVTFKTLIQPNGLALVTLWLQATTVAGVVGPSLVVALPAALLPVADARVICDIVDAGVAAVGFAVISTGAAQIVIRRQDGANWTAGVNNTSVYLQVWIEVAP